MSVYSSGPIGLQLRPILLRYLNSLGTTASFSSLSKLGLLRLSQALLINYYIFVIIFYILTIPYMLSPVDHCYIRHASPLLRPIKGVKGIYLFYYPNTKRQKRDMIPGYLLCLGPSY